MYFLLITTLGLQIYIYAKDIEEKEEDKDLSDYDVYINFINNHYEIFKSYFNNTLEDDNKYNMDDSEYLTSLKEKVNHFKTNLPFEYNDKIIFFYDSENEHFNYYTQTADVTYKVLNSVCREYLIQYKCLQLYKDDDNIKYIKKLIKKDENSDYETSESEEEEEKKETEETDEGFLSIFHVKKKDNKKVIKNKNKNKRINKYIYKGNFNEYNNIYKDKANVNDIDYNSFKTKLS